MDQAYATARACGSGSPPSAGKGTVAAGIDYDLHGIVGVREVVFSAWLVSELVQLEGRPWPEFGRSRKPITANGLARLLRPFGLHPATVRDGAETGRGYYRKALDPVWTQYRIGALDPPLTTVTSNTIQERRGETGFRQPTQPPNCDGCESGKKPGGASIVLPVTVVEGGLSPLDDGYSRLERQAIQAEGCA